MFPISSLTPTATTQPVTNSGGLSPVGTATDAPPANSVTVDLSPVASFLVSVTNAQEQLAQTQSNTAQRANVVNSAVQEVVDAFNLLPSVDIDQQQVQQTSLLNNLLNSLNQQTNDGINSQAQNLAQLGITLQPPLISDLTGGLSLEPELLRVAVNTNDDQTTATLQNTLNTFRQLATEFAEQLSAAGSSQISGLNAAPPAQSQIASQQATATVINADATTQAEQNGAAQAAAARAAANAPTDPLRANPALAAAIAAYNINGVAGANVATVQTRSAVIPLVDAVQAVAAARNISNAP